MRSGAAIGLAFLEDTEFFLEALKIASQREPVDWIREDLEALLSDLGADAD